MADASLDDVGAWLTTRVRTLLTTNDGVPTLYSPNARCCLLCICLPCCTLPGARRVLDSSFDDRYQVRTGCSSHSLPGPASSRLRVPLRPGNSATVFRIMSWLVSGRRTSAWGLRLLRWTRWKSREYSAGAYIQVHLLILIPVFFISF